jgi:hypothetical protein
MERPTCATCVHFDGTRRQYHDGTCLLSPSVLVEADPDGSWWAQPGMNRFDSCSHHPQFPRFLATLDEGRHAPETMP